MDAETIKKAVKARHDIGQALRSGRMKRPDFCQKCGRANIPMKDGRSSIQAHHHDGYDNSLSVEWLCVKCHRAVTPVPHGEKAAAARVGWDLVTEIRGRFGSGESYYRIADELGFNRTTIHRIVTHRSWPEHARPCGGQS